MRVEFIYKLVVFGVGGAGLAEVGGAVHDRLLLVFVVYAGYDGLDGDAEALVVDDHRAERVQAVYVEHVERLDALQVVDLRTHT